MPEIVQSLNPSIDLESIYVRKRFWITMAVIFISPVTFARKLNSLRYTSGLALLAVVYLFSIVLGYYATWPEGMPGVGRIPWEDIEWWNWNGGSKKDF